MEFKNCFIEIRTKKVLLSPTEPLLKWQRVTLTLLLVHRIHKNYTFVQVNNLQ